MSDSEKTSEAGFGFSPAASSGAVNRTVHELVGEAAGVER